MCPECRVPTQEMTLGPPNSLPKGQAPAFRAGGSVSSGPGGAWQKKMPHPAAPDQGEGQTQTLRA